VCFLLAQKTSYSNEHSHHFHGIAMYTVWIRNSYHNAWRVSSWWWCYGNHKAMWNFNTIKNSLEIGPILAPKSQVHCSNIETPESTLSEPVQFDLTFFPPSRTRVDEVVSLNLPVKRFLYSRLVPHSAPRVSWLKHWQVKFTGLLTNLGNQNTRTTIPYLITVGRA